MHQQHPNNSMYQLFVTLFMSDHEKLPPHKISTDIFTQNIFKYSSAKFFLRRWDYRIDMTFDSKGARQNAIEELKKIKSQYSFGYHYQFKKVPLPSTHLMDLREYYRLIEQSYKSKHMISQRSEKLVKKGSSLSDGGQKPKKIQINLQKSAISNMEIQQQRQTKTRAQKQKQKNQEMTRKKEEEAKTNQEAKAKQQKVKQIMKNNQLLTKLINYELALANQNQIRIEH